MTSVHNLPPPTPGHMVAHPEVINNLAIIPFIVAHPPDTARTQKHDSPAIVLTDLLILKGKEGYK